MAVVNIMFGGYDSSDEINTVSDAVAAETTRAKAAEKAISDELDGVSDLLSKI